MIKNARFGVRLPVAGPLANRDGIARSAAEAERLGFDSVWVHDYVIWNQLLDSIHISCGSKEAFDAASARADYSPVFYESLINLAYLAGVTDTIRLGVAVLCLPYRDPVVTAKQIACIDTLSEGRVELGVGQGAAKSTHNAEFEALGISRRTKVKHTREILEAMQRIWTEDSASFSGEFFSFEGVEIYPKPHQEPHPPIWIGGSRELSLEMIADYADGWLSYWVSPTQFPRAIEDLESRFAKRGRDPGDLTVGTEIQIYLADTTEQAKKEVEPTMLAFEEGYAGTTGGFADEGERADTLAEIWNASLVGTPESVTERIQEYLDSGCTFFELKFIYHTVDHMIEQWTRFTEEVAPNFA